jgi:sec-independent protein translocase protein TatA
MGLENPIHLAILLMILLLVFGAKRLPEMGRSLGSGLRGFKDAINGDEPAEPATAPVLAAAPAPVMATAPPVMATAPAPVVTAAPVPVMATAPAPVMAVAPVAAPADDTAA